MSYRHIEPLSKQLTIVVGLSVVAIMAFGLFHSFYQNLLFERLLRDLENQNKKISRDIDQGYRDLEYFRSDHYKDKYAKENLNLLNPGEKILIISQKVDPIPESSPIITLDPSEKQEAQFREILRQMPVFEHWNLYLFHREKVEDLKRSL
jgi:hypothetical protein